MRSPRQQTGSEAGLKLGYLKANELFQDFTPAQLEPFHHTIQMASCRAGHVFYQAGETGEVMFLVKEGSAQLYRMSPDGRKLQYPSFALRLLEAVAGRMVDAERQLEALAFKAVMPRLADLLRREVRDGVVEGLSHQDLGDRLGVYRETVTEALNELKAAGLLEIGRRRIRVLDEARLRAIADT